MPWTNEDLKIALEQISNKSNITNIVTIINAQTTTDTKRIDISAYAVEAYLSQTGEIGHLLDLAADPATAMQGWTYPPGVTVALVRAVVRNMLNIIQSSRLQVFATSTDTGFNAVAQGIELLVAVGLISVNTQTTLMDMTKSTPQPKWIPEVTFGDIQSVLGQ